MSQVAKKMAELGLVLPAAPAAVGAYVPALRTGSLVMTSGQLNLVAGKLSAVGKVGSDLNVEQGGGSGAGLRAQRTGSDCRDCRVSRPRAESAAIGGIRTVRAGVSRSASRFEPRLEPAAVDLRGGWKARADRDWGGRTAAQCSCSAGPVVRSRMKRIACVPSGPGAHPWLIGRGILP